MTVNCHIGKINTDVDGLDGFMRKLREYSILASLTLSKVRIRLFVAEGGELKKENEEEKNRVPT